MTPTKKRYAMKTELDLDILEKCKLLEKCELKKRDKSLVKLIKTQLLKDWRTPLVKELNRISKQYKQKNAKHQNKRTNNKKT